MKTPLVEFEAAKLYEQEQLVDFPSLEATQIEDFRAEARRFVEKVRAHRWAHNLFNLLLLVALLVADGWVLLFLPELLLHAEPSLGRQLAAAVFTGFLHGWLVCGFVTLTVHEGAAHNLIILGTSPTAKRLRFLTNHACRLFLADPEYYREGHRRHHGHFGTAQDGAFTNSVSPHRVLGTLKAMAPFLNISNFFPWLPPAYTRSRLISMGLTFAYAGPFIAVMFFKFGLVFTIVAYFMVGTMMSYAFDRCREAVEHNMMPLNNENGTRELGLGFWGLLLGGGPWGQPCHMVHHLAPNLPWYGQIRMHFYLRALLTPHQRRAFFMTPLIGFPRLVWAVLRQVPAYHRRAAATLGDRARDTIGA